LLIKHPKNHLPKSKQIINITSAAISHLLLMIAIPFSNQLHPFKIHRFVYSILYFSLSSPAESVLKRGLVFFHIRETPFWIKKGFVL